MPLMNLIRQRLRSAPDEAITGSANASVVGLMIVAHLASLSVLVEQTSFHRRLLRFVAGAGADLRFASLQDVCDVALVSFYSGMSDSFVEAVSLV